jgi:hypothetical protein
MPDGCLEVVLHSNQALEHKHKLLRAKTACVAKWQCAGAVLPFGNACLGAFSSRPEWTTDMGISLKGSKPPGPSNPLGNSFL